MRFFILLLLVLQTSISYSQPPGGGGGGRPSGGGGNQQGQRPPRDDNKESMSFEETNIKEFAGLLQLDSKVILKDLKIKVEEEKEALQSLFIVFNNQLMEIEKEHLLLIETTELETRIKEKKAIEDKDVKAMFEAKRNASIVLEPVTNKTFEAKKVLNMELESKLSEKSFKKWMKYFEKNIQKKRPTLPKENNSDDNQDRKPPRRMN